MNNSRRELLDTFLHMHGEYGDTRSRDLAERLLNVSYLDIWLRHPFKDHRMPDPVQVTTVADQRTYALPPYFGRIPPHLRVRNLTTGRDLVPYDLDALWMEFPEAGTDLEVASVPERYSLGGVSAVTTQPDAAGQALELVSSHASDTDIAVVVQGLNSDGVVDEAQLTLNGTTPVAAGTWFPPITGFTKAYTEADTPDTEHTSSRGTVTLRLDSAGATLQKLLPEQSQVEIPTIVLHPKPITAGQIIGVPCLRLPKRLLYDADTVPQFWVSALLERMGNYFKVNRGELTDVDQGSNASLIALVGHDNTIQPARPRIRPFMG
jgi:hypothetical protein